MAGVRARVRVTGQAKVKRLLKLFDKRVTRGIKNCVARSAFSIQREAKNRIRSTQPQATKPAVLTGNLLASIRVDFFGNGLGADILTDVEYAQFIEYGTGGPGRSTLPAGTPLPEDYRHGSGPGMVARPYMFPSWDEEVPNFLKCTEEVLSSAASGFNR